MTSRQQYSYTVLRYVHDVLTGEFVNVGVVLHAPSSGFIRARIRTTVGRIKGAFPDLDSDAFKSALADLRKAMNRLANAEAGSGFLKSDGDAGALARRVLPADDSSLQWSPPGVGMTNDPAATLERLYARMVERHDSKSKRRKTEDDVWKPIRVKLEERHLADHLEEKVIRGGADDIEFKHAWKNGVWHCLEPISLDLSDADHIKDKARRWLGNLSAAIEGAEAFKAYFIVGAPADPSLAKAYRAALAILEKSPGDVSLYQEDQADELVALIESEMRAHEGRPAAN